MKKILILGAILFIMPFATFAHGTIDDGDGNTATASAQETMMGGGETTMTSGADHSGGSMDGGMVWMNLLHGLVAVTSIVWLIAGIIFLYNQTRRKRSYSSTHVE